MRIMRDIEDAYFCVLYTCLSSTGDVYLQKVEEGSFIGQYRLQLPFIEAKINHAPGQRPFVPTPEGKPHLAICDDKYIEEVYINYLMGTKKATNEAYTYGERINRTLWIKEWDGNSYRWRRTTQLAQAIEKLTKTRGTNQATIAIEEPSDILLESPPCIRTIDLKVVHGRLNMTLFSRSWDVYAGMPVNLAGFQLMKEALAVMTGLKTGCTYISSSGCHIYQQDWPVACERIGFKYDQWVKGAEEEFGVELRG